MGQMTKEDWNSYSGRKEKFWLVLKIKARAKDYRAELNETKQNFCKRRDSAVGYGMDFVE